MNVRRALVIAAVLLPWAVGPAMGPAMAQFAPPQPQAQEPPCLKDFARLRDDAEKKATAVMAAQKRKVPLPEACKLLSVFAAAQDKMLKFAKMNQVWCGIPPQFIQQIELGHKNAVQARTKVCQMAAQPQRPVGPSLSDTLGGSIPDASNIKTGRGTFDTLTGSPIAPK